MRREQMALTASPVRRWQAGARSMWCEHAGSAMTGCGFSGKARDDTLRGSSLLLCGITGGLLFRAEGSLMHGAAGWPCRGVAR